MESVKKCLVVSIQSPQFLRHSSKWFSLIEYMHKGRCYVCQSGSWNFGAVGNKQKRTCLPVGWGVSLLCIPRWSLVWDWALGQGKTAVVTLVQIPNLPVNVWHQNTTGTYSCAYVCCTVCENSVEHTGILQWFAPVLSSRCDWVKWHIFRTWQN